MIALPEQHDAFLLLTDLEEFLNSRASLFWGNLLGAVRHGGFIPWDDDLDLLIDRASVGELVAFCKAQGVEVFRHPGHFLKLYRADGAVCRPDLPWRWPFIDVFLYDLVRGEVRTRFEDRLIRIPAAHVLPFRPTLFEGQAWLAPACPLAVLRALYGDYETYRIKTYDHRSERPALLDELVERVNAAYWRQNQPEVELPPSSFAPVATAAFAHAEGRVLDLGSGDGRDARYFREQGLEVDECDSNSGVGGDALTVDLSGYRRVYSRWLLHTLSARQQQYFLKRLAEVQPGTIVCLEFRDLADAASLTPVANDARLFFDGGHFRLLVSAGDVLSALGPGFAVLSHAMGRFSPAPGSDPVLSRLVLRKL